MSITLPHGGLPADVRPLDLPDILAKLRRQLGLRDEDIAYIRHLLRNVRREDFEPGRICAIWTSVTRLADELGLSVRQINRIETRLSERMLICRTTMRNGRRFGRRMADGRIAAASGINIAPLIDRATGLLALVSRKATTAADLRSARDKANELIREIRGLDAPEALDAARAVFPRLRPSEVQSHDRLVKIIDALSAVVADFSVCSGRTIVTAASDSSGRPDTKEDNKTETCSGGSQAERRVPRTSPDQVILLASVGFREVISLYADALTPGGPPTWQVMGLAARERAAMIGISGAQWAASCDLLGEAQSVLCLLIADRNAARTGRFRVRDAASAFVGMVHAEARGKAITTALLGELVQFSKDGGQTCRQ